MPHLTRRTALAGAASTLGAAHARAAPSARAVFAYVGTYTPDGGGVHVLRFDPGRGTLSPVAVVGGVANPTWLTVDPVRRRLFALSETADFGPRKTGAVTAFAMRPDGGLERLNTVSSGAAGPAHVSLHPSGRFLFAADYGGGAVAVVPVGDDGRLGEPRVVVFVERRPPPALLAGPPGSFAASDHAAPHVHMVAPDPAGRFALACDAGSDRIYVWRFDPDRGRLFPAEVPFVETPPGSAPRHFAFLPGGRVVHVLQERDARIATYAYDARTGGLTRIGFTPTLPDGFAGSVLASEIAVSADGRRLYAANRMRDSIVTFAATPDGTLRRLGEGWTQGDHPRSFTLSPDGRWLVCCCQRSDSLTTFRLDPATGLPAFTGAFTPVGSPAAVVFAASPA